MNLYWCLFRAFACADVGQLKAKHSTRTMPVDITTEHFSVQPCRLYSVIIRLFVSVPCTNALLFLQRSHIDVQMHYYTRFALLEGAL